MMPEEPQDIYVFDPATSLQSPGQVRVPWFGFRHSPSSCLHLSVTLAGGKGSLQTVRLVWIRQTPGSQAAA